MPTQLFETAHGGHSKSDRSPVINIPPARCSHFRNRDACRAIPAMASCLCGTASPPIAAQSAPPRTLPAGECDRVIGALTTPFPRGMSAILEKSAWSRRNNEGFSMVDQFEAPSRQLVSSRKAAVSIGP